MVLYRKYRPQKFSDVVGQEIIVKTLQRAIEGGKVSHAYLFAGPRGTGKTSMARIFAKALDCKQRALSEPCNTCKSCQEITAGNSLDIVEIDAASNRGIDEIRELRERIKFLPTDGNYKVYIVDESHMLTREAFNALLKTLEEPPEHAVFILATTEPHKMPETVVSRCQSFYFKRHNLLDIANKIKFICQNEGTFIEDEAADMIAMSAEGGMRDAETMLEQAMHIAEGKITKELVRTSLGLSDPQLVREYLTALLTEKNTAKAVTILKEVYERGEDLENFLNLILLFLRKILLFQMGGREEDSIVRHISDGMRPSRIQTISEIFLKAKENLPKYPIEIISLEIATAEVYNLIAEDH